MISTRRIWVITLAALALLCAAVVPALGHLPLDPPLSLTLTPAKGSAGSLVHATGSVPADCVASADHTTSVVLVWDNDQTPLRTWFDTKS